MVAGDTPSITRTMLLAVYAALQEGETHTATTFALLSAAICITVCTLAARPGQK